MKPLLHNTSENIEVPQGFFMGASVVNTSLWLCVKLCQNQFDIVNMRGWLMWQFVIIIIKNHNSPKLFMVFDQIEYILGFHEQMLKQTNFSGQCMIWLWFYDADYYLIAGTCCLFLIRPLGVCFCWGKMMAAYSTPSCAFDVALVGFTLSSLAGLFWKSNSPYSTQLTNTAPDLPHCPCKTHKVMKTKLKWN